MNVLKFIYFGTLLLCITKIVFSQEDNGDNNIKHNLTANDLIHELSKLADDNIGRQRYPPPNFSNYQNQQYPYYDDYPSFPNPQQKPYKKKRPNKQRPYRPDFDPQRPPGFDPYLQQYPQDDPYFQQPYPQGNPFLPNNNGPFSSLSQALYSIARHDDQHCVPRLLCEVAAGGDPGGRQTQSFLPSFLNMESLFTLLSAFTGDQVSPFLVFGRAAVLGATSRGNPSSCRYAYPNCPRDPDRLVDYLNNHNGGFFRFFNGLQPAQVNFPQEQQDQYYQGQQNFDTQQQQQYQQQLNPNRPNGAQYYQGQQNFDTLQQQQYQQQLNPNRPNGAQYYQGQQNRPYIQQNPYRPNRYRPRTNNNITEDAQSRILTKAIVSNQIPKPTDLYIAQSYFYPDIIKGDNSFRFPEETRSHIHTNSIVDSIKDEQFKFPSNSNRRPKGLHFPNNNNEDQNQNIFYPTPLPFYDHSKMIFPDRTGTGNLKFDSNKLLQSTYNRYYNNDLVPNYNIPQTISNGKPTYVYIVRDDPNHPELVAVNGRKFEDRNEDVHVNDDRKRRGIPWTFPTHLQGVTYNDRSFDVKN